MITPRIRPFAALLGILVVGPPMAASAQDGPLQKAGRALDKAGKAIRNEIEGAVNREHLSAQERELMDRITGRLVWDKKLVGSALSIEVQADGTAVLRGSVASEAMRTRAADLVENTLGVTRVVDELGLAQGARVIETKPGDPARVIVIQPKAATAPAPAPVPATPDPKVIPRP
ncbi:MAG: BON domain-containing protein [Isosphaeraceae bacterium]